MGEPTNLWWSHLQSVRWFGGKGRKGGIAQITPQPWYTPEGVLPAIRSEIAEVVYDTGETEHYHLLVAYRPGEMSGSLGQVALPGLGVCGLTDVVTDPEAVTVLGRVVAPDAGPARVWTVEQSNSMIALGEDALIKVFRKLEPGPNLEAELLSGLAGRDAPRLLGRLTVPWPENQTTDVGLVMERIPASEDGFVLAGDACAAGRDFSPQATELGRTLARVHARLAEAFGVSTVFGDAITEEMISRLDDACTQYPQLEPFRAAASQAFEVLRGETLPVQRIHGDFHLGQALWADGRWTLLDFEGEPAKTYQERRRPDSPWRDVAGLFRSIDYATSRHQDPQSPQAAAWAEQAREAFWSGYCGSNSSVPKIVTAYEMDKAIYEVGYELRNRPTWVDIPLGALQRQLRTTSAP